MERDKELVVAQYVYRSDLKKVRRRSSLYLVAQLEGSNVVARIEALESPSQKREAATTRTGDAEGVRLLGPWRTTTSRRHSRARVDLGTRNRSVAKTGRFREEMVVETGVDPVTSRFSGARSTN